MGQVQLGANVSDILADGLDGIILKQNISDKIGGVALDATGFPNDYIRTGHLVIYNPAVANSHKPMPLNAQGTAYATLPENFQYYGVVVNSVRKQGNGFGVGVCHRGEMNPAVKNVENGVMGIDGALLTAVKTALPLLVLRKDNE